MNYLRIIFFFSFLSVFSQSKQVDSLELALKNHKVKDTLYVDLLNEIAIKIYSYDNDKAVKLLNRALNYSDSIYYPKGKARSYYILGEVQRIKLDFEKAIYNLETSLVIYEDLGDELGKAKILSRLGVVYFQKLNPEKALDFYYQSIEISKKINDTDGLALTYLNIGLFYGDKKEYNKALYYYYKALKIYRKLNKSINIAILLNNIGVVYVDEKKYDEALEVCQESLSISNKIKNSYLIGYATQNLGEVLKEKKKYKKAIDLLFKSLKIHKSIEDYSGVSHALNEIGSVYLRLNQYDKAIFYINKSKKNAVKYNLLKQQLKSNKLLSTIYQNKKEYKKALHFFKQYKTQYDSVDNARLNSIIAELERKYSFKQDELALKEKEIKFKNKIDITNKKLNKTKRQILIGLVLLLFLLMMFMISVYYSRTKRLLLKFQKIELEQRLLRSQMKPHFIFNSLAVLQGIVFQKDYKKANKYLSKFSSLLRQILETSREESINLKKEIEIIENYIFLRTIGSSFNEFTYNIKIDNKIDVNKTFMPPIIIQPIIENSFEHGFVKKDKIYNLDINFKLDYNILICTIVDNGEGLSNNKKNNEFNRKNSISYTIINERLKQFSKKHVTYDIKISNLKNEELTGVKVVLKLPYKISK